MSSRLRCYSLLIAALMLATAATCLAQTVQGEATAARIAITSAPNLLGGISPLQSVTTLASTGTLSSANDVLDAAQTAANVPSLFNGEVLSASTMSWPDEVDSVASLANLNLTVAGIGISADFVMAEASQVLGTAGSGTSMINNLAINGTPVAITGIPNQTVSIPGGQIVINQQSISSDGAAVVNALHITISGVADVVIASATAGIS